MFMLSWPFHLYKERSQSFVAGSEQERANGKRERLTEIDALDLGRDQVQGWRPRFAVRFPPPPDLGDRQLHAFWTQGTNTSHGLCELESKDMEIMNLPNGKTPFTLPLPRRFRNQSVVHFQICGYLGTA